MLVINIINVVINYTIRFKICTVYAAFLMIQGLLVILPDGKECGVYC